MHHSTPSLQLGIKMHLYLVHCAEHPFSKLRRLYINGIQETQPIEQNERKPHVTAKLVAIVASPDYIYIITISFTAHGIVIRSNSLLFNVQW